MPVSNTTCSGPKLTGAAMYIGSVTGAGKPSPAPRATTVALAWIVAAVFRETTGTATPIPTAAVAAPPALPATR